MKSSRKIFIAKIYISIFCLLLLSGCLKQITEKEEPVYTVKVEVESDGAEQDNKNFKN